MPRKKNGKTPPPETSSTTPGTMVVLRLYIADNAPNSVRAVANLEAICKEYSDHQFKLEIIDVLEYPLRALADGVLVTPSLAKLSPSPTTKVVGNLSDKPSVLRALGLNGASR
jgi:circadian clock protein KaiB